MKEFFKRYILEIERGGTVRDKILTYSSSVLSSCSIFLSAQDIESYLNIAFITISVLILCINFGLRVYDRLKDGKVTKQEIRDTVEDIENLTEEIKNKTKGGN